MRKHNSTHEFSGMWCFQQVYSRRNQSNRMANFLAERLPAGSSHPFQLQLLILSAVSAMVVFKSNEPEQSRDFVKQSSLYQEFLAEREEILRHKWLESERLVYDIGFERALLDWIRKHREGWRAARRAQSVPNIGKTQVRSQ
jgi:hypothetical protein